jgi:TetR/AcrR family fatty acid metabolism transcriptional regulator
MSLTPKPSKAEVVTDFRRSQILGAARDAFARHGLSGTTVDSIAKRAGVAKGTVYLYYRSKEEILRQVLDEDLAELKDDTVPLLSQPGSIEDKLTAFLTASLTFFDRKRDFFEHAHFEMTPEVRRKALQKLETVYKAQHGAWRDALTSARAAGLVGDIDPDASAVVIVALASGLAKQRLRGWTPTPVASSAQQAAVALWKGLAAR